MRSSIALSLAVTLSALLVSSSSLAGSSKGRSAPTQVAQAADTPADPARNAIARELVTPLAAKEQNQNRYSRAWIPPHDRRVQVLDPHKDDKGETFVSFTIDEGRAGASEDSWRKGAITGCVYPASGKVFVNRGDTWFPAAMLLGKTAESAGTVVCRGG